MYSARSLLIRASVHLRGSVLIPTSKSTVGGVLRHTRYASSLSFRNPGKVFQNEPAYSKEELANQAANANLLRLVEAYRRYGHFQADLNPIAPASAKVAQLSIDNYGFSEKDLASSFKVKGIVNLGKESATLSEILQHLEKTYCSKVGVQFTHVESDAERKWLHEQIENLSKQTLTKEEKLQAYNLISKSETFDNFMHKRFPGTKRYGLEGNETMMSVVEEIFKSSSRAGLDDIVIGMPHRGRLNLLTGLLNYAPRHIFWKCQGESEIAPGVLSIGDVLSHIGTSVDLNQYGKPVHVSLIQNPSHLEVCLL